MSCNPLVCFISCFSFSLWPNEIHFWDCLVTVSSVVWIAIPASAMVMQRDKTSRMLQIWQPVAFLCFCQSSRVITSGFLFAISSLFFFFLQDAGRKHADRTFSSVNGGAVSFTVTSYDCVSEPTCLMHLFLRWSFHLWAVCSPGSFSPKTRSRRISRKALSSA